MKLGKAANTLAGISIFLLTSQVFRAHTTCLHSTYEVDVATLTAIFGLRTAGLLEEVRPHAEKRGENVENFKIRPAGHRRGGGLLPKRILTAVGNVEKAVHVLLLLVDVRHQSGCR